MAYHIKLVSPNGDESDTFWPGDEESARRHTLEQVVSGKARSARLVDDAGTVIAEWPEGGGTAG